jgi:hypothetical protein
MYLSGHQYSCPDVFKFSVDLIAGRDIDWPSSYHYLLKGEAPIRMFWILG